MKLRSGTGEVGVLKVLNRSSDLIFSRFMAEIEALKLAKKINGIVPLVDEDFRTARRRSPAGIVTSAKTGRMVVYRAAIGLVQDAAQFLARECARIDADRTTGDT